MIFLYQDSFKKIERILRVPVSILHVCLKNEKRERMLSDCDKTILRSFFCQLIESKHTAKCWSGYYSLNLLNYQLNDSLNIHTYIWTVYSIQLALKIFLYNVKCNKA